MKYLEYSGHAVLVLIYRVEKRRRKRMCKSPTVFVKNMLALQYFCPKPPKIFKKL